QFVNIVGSIFYGTVLGIFLCAFFLKRITGVPVFIAALISQVFVLVCFFTTEIGFLWYNVIGCAGVMLLAVIIQQIRKRL
nr:sodium:solute symporter [Bacteroidota bacterium]